MRRPEWWDWRLILTPHLELRMEERDFTEIDLRRMLDLAGAVKTGRAEGRFEIVTRHAGQDWIVVLEPDPAEKVIYVVTAFAEGQP